MPTIIFSKNGSKAHKGTYGSRDVVYDPASLNSGYIAEMFSGRGEFKFASRELAVSFSASFHFVSLLESIL